MKIGYNIDILTRVTLFRASPRHFGAWRFNLKRKKQEFPRLTVLIRRGGAPPGAAAFILTGGMGVSTPIMVPEFHQFLWEIIWINHSVEFARVTPSLPQRGRQPKGACPLDPRFSNWFFTRIQYPALLHRARPSRCLHRFCDADLRRRSLLAVSDLWPQRKFSPQFLTAFLQCKYFFKAHGLRPADWAPRMRQAALRGNK